MLYIYNFNFISKLIHILYLYYEISLLYLSETDSSESLLRCIRFVLGEVCTYR